MRITAVREENPAACQIVGVARNGRTQSLRDSVEPRYFLAAAQAPLSGTSSPTFLIRTSRDGAPALAAVRKTIQQVDAAAPILSATSIEEQMAPLTAQDRATAQLAVVFGGVALALAAIGLYGVLSCGVARRTGEIAIRVALGAQGARVIAMILGETVVTIAVGLGLGAAFAYAASRLIGSRLYGVAPQDPLTLLSSTGLLVLVAILAAYGPARARVEGRSDGGAAAVVNAIGIRDSGFGIRATPVHVMTARFSGEASTDPCPRRPAAGSGTESVHLVAAAVFGDAEQILDARESRFTGQVVRDIGDRDRRHRVDDNVAVVNLIAAAHFDARILPDANGAPDSSAPDSSRRRLANTIPTSDPAAQRFTRSPSSRVAMPTGPTPRQVRNERRVIMPRLYGSALRVTPLGLASRSNWFSSCGFQHIALIRAVPAAPSSWSDCPAARRPCRCRANTPRRPPSVRRDPPAPPTPASNRGLAARRFPR
mgnify:CR=1 FL=1